MSKGVLYKFNASSPSKSQSKKFSASSSSDGKVRHADASNWYDNYPMEQVYEQYFNVVWTQGYNGSGAKLDPATWGDHPRSGDTIDFHGLWGFDRTAMRDFVANGVVQDLQIVVRFDDPSHAGNPDAEFYPHNYTSKPSSYSSTRATKSYKKSETFNQTGSDYTRWVKLPVEAWWNGDLAGIVVSAPSATGANSARFAGKTSSHNLSSYTTKLFIQVLK